MSCSITSGFTAGAPVDSLALLVTAAGAVVQEVRHHRGNGTFPRAVAEKVDALEAASSPAALRPYLAPVGAEAFEGLRREHLCFDPTSNEECTDSRCCSCNVDAACTCGAARANALLDQCIAAHVAAMGEAETLIEDRAGDKHDPFEVAEFLDGQGDRANAAIGEALHDAADVVRGLAAMVAALRAGGGR